MNEQQKPTQNDIFEGLEALVNTVKSHENCGAIILVTNGKRAKTVSRLTRGVLMALINNITHSKDFRKLILFCTRLASKHSPEVLNDLMSAVVNGVSDTIIIGEKRINLSKDED